MMHKEESLELANKLMEEIGGFGFVPDSAKQMFVTLFTSAIEEKHQASPEFRKWAEETIKANNALIESQAKQIAMLRDMAKNIIESSGENCGCKFCQQARSMISATQATADAREAEVKARALDVAHEEIDANPETIAETRKIAVTKEWMVGYTQATRDAQHYLRTEAAELRNQQPEQPRKPCTCDGWCDGLCLEKEGKRK